MIRVNRAQLAETSTLHSSLHWSYNKAANEGFTHGVECYHIPTKGLQTHYFKSYKEAVKASKEYNPKYLKPLGVYTIQQLIDMLYS